MKQAAIVLCMALCVLVLLFAGCSSSPVKATRKGDVEELSEYIAKGGDVNALQKGGASLLMTAAASGQVESATLLLDSGANIEQRDAQGRTALMYAASAGQVATLQLLLERGAKIDARDNAGSTSLIAASGVNQMATVQILLDKGAALDVMANAGWTALLAALDRSAQQPAEVNSVARLLSSRGAALDAASDAATQVAFRAARSGNDEVLTLLLGKGLNAKARDNAGNSLLMAAAADERLAELLIGRGLSVNDRNNAGETALMIAAGKGSLASARLLLESGADPNVAAQSGQTALLAAASRRNAELVRLLLLSRANPRALDRSGNSPLHHAAREGDANTVRLLVTAGTDVNAANTAGETPIVLARKNPDSEAITKILLAAGAVAPAAPAAPAAPGTPAAPPAAPVKPAAPGAPGAPGPGQPAAPITQGPAGKPQPPGGPAAPAGPGAPGPSTRVPVAGSPRIVDTGATRVKARVSWAAIRPSSVDGWNASDPMQTVASIRMRTYRQAEWFLTHNVAVPARQSGLDPFEQSYDLRVDASRMIECQVSILTASGKSVNSTIVAPVAAATLAFAFTDFRLTASADVAWPPLGTPVAAAFRYSLEAVPAAIKRQLQAAGDAITRKRQPRGADVAEIVLTLSDSAGKQLATDRQLYDPDAPAQGTFAIPGRLPEGSAVRYSFEVATTRGRLVVEGEAPVYSVYSHATKSRPAAEAFTAPGPESWIYRRR